MQADIKTLKSLDEHALHVLKNSPVMAKCLASYEMHPLHIAYQKEYHGPSFEDHSIVGFSGNRPCLIVMAISQAGYFDLFKHPTTVYSAFESAQEEIEVYKQLGAYLQKLMTEQKTVLSINSDSILNRAIFSFMNGSSNHFYGIVDTTLTNEQIFSNLRKSYKSLVNWGKKNLTLTKIDHSNLNEESFNGFRQLHFEAAGRSTRSDKTWEIQYQQIKEGAAFLVCASIEDKMVAGTLILLGLESAYYGVAASNREMMEKNLPLMHWPVIYSISQVKELGIKTFSFGSFDLNSKDAKLAEIIKFKRGFCTHIVSGTSLEFGQSELPAE